jgi:hypothetical protein
MSNFNQTGYLSNKFARESRRNATAGSVIPSVASSFARSAQAQVRTLAAPRAAMAYNLNI